MEITIKDALRVIKAEQPKRPTTVYGIIKKSAFDVAIKALERQEYSLTEEDILELKHRYGDEVEYIVRDMLSGENKRWKGNDIK